MIKVKRFKYLYCTILVALCFSSCSGLDKQRTQTTKIEVPDSTNQNTQFSKEPELNLEYQQRCYKNFCAFPNELNMLVESKQPLTKFAAKIVKCTHNDNQCIFTIDKVDLGEDNDNKEQSLEQKPLYTNIKEEKENIKVCDDCLVFLDDFTQCNAMELGENLDKEQYQNVSEADGTTAAIYVFYTYGDHVLLMFSIAQP